MHLLLLLPVVVWCGYPSLIPDLNCVVMCRLVARRREESALKRDEIVLRYIVERKTINDLGSSILDGRSVRF